MPRPLSCSTLLRDQAGQSSRFVLFSAREKGPMVEREVEITEAMLQRLLQAFRRGLKPLTPRVLMKSGKKGKTQLKPTRVKT